MSSLSLALEIIGRDLTGGAFGSVIAHLGMLDAAGNVSGANQSLEDMATTLGILTGAAVGAGIAFTAFAAGLTAAVETGAQLQQAGTMASIAIADGAQHVNELEAAIVQLANTSQYKIADVDMAFRVLGGLGFDTGQILGGLGQQVIILAQAMGGPGAGISAADAAHLLGQAIYLFGNNGLTAAHAADVLTGAFYNNMMSVSDLTEYLGMAGGTASALGVSFDQLMTFGSMLTPMFGSASSAGASLAYMMRNLAHPATSKMADEIQKLGLVIYDSNGQFVGLKSIMDQLFTDMQGMTEQQKMDIFGTLFNVRSGRAAMDLMNQTKQSFDDAYTRINDRLNQANQANRDATDINNTAIGSWNRLKTTVNDFFAMAGIGIVNALIPLINKLNDLFSALQKDPTKEKFFAGLLVIGTVLSGLALAVAGLTILFTVFAGPAAIAMGIIGGIIYVAGILAGLFTILTTNGDIFTGQLAPLNYAVDAVREAFGALGTVWKYDIIPLLQQQGPLLKLLFVALLVVAGFIALTVIGTMLAFAAAITAVMLALAGIGWAIVKAADSLHHIQDVINTAMMNISQGMWQWGHDMLQNFINGILSQLGPLRGAIGQIGVSIHNVLGHSTPVEGPLKDDDQWGAHLVQNFATGMVGAIPTLRSATGQVAGAIGLSPSAPSGLGYTPVSGFGGYQGGQQVVIPIYIGEDVVAEYGYNTMTQQLTMNGMARQFR